MDTGFKKRLYTFICFKKMTPSNFARCTDIDKQSILNYIKGKQISPRNLNKILEYNPELNEVWLITGTGEMLKAVSPNIQENAPIGVILSEGWKVELDSLKRALQNDICKLTQDIECKQTMLKFLNACEKCEDLEKHLKSL